ncbi:MAG: hypothetical protein ACOCX8_04635 [Bacteroidota bacterium]
MSNGRSNTVLFAVAGLIIIIIAILLYMFMFSSSAKFDRLISQADENFAANRMTKAKQLYAEAALLNPDDIYPDVRLAKIDSILTVRDQRTHYRAKLKMADSLFVLKDYAGARDYFFEALNIDPNDNYPVDQIKRIEELIAESEAKKYGPETGENYHVVVGVFQHEKNARELHQQLISQGEESLILPRAMFDMQAVTIASFDNIHDAYNHMFRIRDSLNGDAWVLYHQGQ